MPTHELENSFVSTRDASTELQFLQSWKGLIESNGSIFRAGSLEPKSFEPSVTIQERADGLDVQQGFVFHDFSELECLEGREVTLQKQLMCVVTEADEEAKLMQRFTLIGQGAPEDPLRRPTKLDFLRD
ncbi:unnamed protein product [Tilletia caries]|uniref:Uncharacterized protein n=1 Tax=Tilletia caries TaxID=13290 RepID=A0ABN7J804_9BASI|nr:unnamed protein product [Tilletia caries]